MALSTRFRAWQATQSSSHMVYQDTSTYAGIGTIPDTGPRGKKGPCQAHAPGAPGHANQAQARLTNLYLHACVGPQGGLSYTFSQ